MKKNLIMAIMALFFVTNLSAQEYIDRNFVITKPFFALVLLDETYPTSGTCKLEVVNFGEIGNTIIMTLDLPEAKKELKELKKEIVEYAWTGKNVHLIKTSDERGVMYSIIRGNTICGILIKSENAEKQGVREPWIAGIKSTEGCISDLHAGMTRFAVEQKTKEVGLSRFEFVKNDGNMKVYTMKWLDMQKRYNWFGRSYSSFTNDKNYGYFWFNANDKLVKWIFP